MAIPVAPVTLTPAVQVNVKSPAVIPFLVKVLSLAPSIVLEPLAQEYVVLGLGGLGLVVTAHVNENSLCGDTSSLVIAAGVTATPNDDNNNNKYIITHTHTSINKGHY